MTTDEEFETRIMALYASGNAIAAHGMLQDREIERLRGEHLMMQESVALGAEDNERLRAINAELLAALERTTIVIQTASDRLRNVHTLLARELADDAMRARAAIAKAKGE